MTAQSTARRGVPAGEVRDHLQDLVNEGATLAWLSAQSGVSEATVFSVLHRERPAVYSRTAEALMAVKSAPPPPRRHVPSGSTRKKVAELIAGGWYRTDVAKAAGVAEYTVQDHNMVSGVTFETSVAIDKVWRVLRHRVGPAPRAYPWLAVQLRPYTIRQVERGSGIKYESVRRLLAGRPVGRETARAICAWMVLQRLRDRTTSKVQTRARAA